MSVTLLPGQNLAALGFLRLSLFGLAILNLLLPAGYWLAETFGGDITEQSLVSIIATLIAPVVAPILVVVILFDYIMSRVRAADEQGELRAHYRAICRIELMLIGLMLACWIPFFVTL